MTNKDKAEEFIRTPEDSGFYTDMGCVYCLQVASLDCFKVGHTKNTGRQRLKNVAVGSRHRLTIYKEIQTDHPALLEKQIHWLLDSHRAENGEFFNVSKLQLDKAIEEAQEHLIKNLPMIQQAEKLQQVKPKPLMLEPTDHIRLLHQQLKEAVRQAFFLGQRIELLQSQLQIAIADNSGINGIASWKWRQSWRLDLELFKQQQPKLFEKYKKLATSRVFRLL